jgi:ribonuclease H / adenosylcobalamin/alpha-ribazole phosphatase
VAAPHGLTVTQDARLREFAFGQWEGLTWDEILASRPQLRTASVTGAARYAPEGGETFDDVTQRVRSFFEDVRTRDRGHVVIVSHAGPLHAALAVLGAADAGDASAHAVSFSPASLTRIAMEERGARLIILGDVRHLHPAG